MSLIVARKAENQLCIISDTKLTYPNHEIKRLKTNPSEGVIKTIIIRSEVSISFAGDIDDAELAIKAIKTDDSIENIIELLKGFHQRSNYKTEFLLCYAISAPIIYKFKNGEYGQVETSWIGDQKAFNLFQENMMDVVKKENKQKSKNTRSLPSKNKPILEVHEMNFDMELSIPEYFSKMSRAMDEVIAASNIDSVGGFKVNVIYKEKFYYNVYTKSYRGNFAIFGEGEHIIGHGDASEGAYYINFFGNSADYTAVALHIRQAKLGIAYFRKDSGLLRPHLYFMDEVDFYDLAIERYNIHATVTTQDRVHKFVTEGKQSFVGKDFQKALQLFTKAAESAKDKQKAGILFFKGVTQLNLQDHASAFQTFQEAIFIDPVIQQRVNELYKRGV